MHSSVMSLTTERIEMALKSLETDKLADQRGKMPSKELIEMLLCEMQRASEILSNQPYYNYNLQRWITA